MWIQKYTGMPRSACSSKIEGSVDLIRAEKVRLGADVDPSLISYLVLEMLNYPSLLFLILLILGSYKIRVSTLHIVL